MIFDFSDRAKWRLSGVDRVRYLNGQVTNDVRRAPPDGTIAACVTTAKGKLCGLILISACPDALLFDAEIELREPLTARLDRYIVADDVELEDVTEAQCLFHVLGAASPLAVEGATVRGSRRLGGSGFDVSAPAAEHDSVLEALTAQGLALADAELAEAVRIEAGIPRWGAELDEDTLPPEAGLDRFAVDYNKGCYIGQEVISRIKSVGHVNRSLTGFLSDAPLAARLDITSSTAPGKPVGRITSAARSLRLARWVALGYLKRGTSPDMPLSVSNPNGGAVEIHVRDLPALP